jgi:hypothetical protein
MEQTIYVIRAKCLPIEARHLVDTMNRKMNDSGDSSSRDEVEKELATVDSSVIKLYELVVEPYHFEIEEE